MGYIFEWFASFVRQSFFWLFLVVKDNNQSILKIKYFYRKILNFLAMDLGNKVKFDMDRYKNLIIQANNDISIQKVYCMDLSLLSRNKEVSDLVLFVKSLPVKPYWNTSL